ncbi:nucleotide sugar dehydrogenase [Blastococcus sp. TML/M2B]|uniref:nucleotide sugar dehydrogenase n=1 Tax=unclassified Blastococcus TaxID=2619396 RepID=UPI00190B6C19|nr:MULTISPECIES: nucleotide sugar dehydrogenase [unclassified Blastococcus]MBN1091265.1 nucleotide sugar dehydrogenase [Blastococcus sp. TML/M2B]MBN1095178.1 nucleotide sugar dehydrogenase [Blastococcus sp. TML/C7B]
MSSAGGRRLVVMGQGYVGLPLTMRALEVGFEVVGFDVDEARVDRLRTGRTYIDDVSDEEIAAALATGRFRPTRSVTDLAGFDVAVITVPTPLRDGAPDLRFVESAATMLAPHVTTGCCVVLESTTYPGTTESVLIPLLEAGSPLRAGQDYRVGYSPERIDPSNPVWNFRNTPKIVSGVDELSTKAVAQFYGGLVDRVVPVAGIREAELTKLLENTFRHVNIALVNELAMVCHGLGIDVWSVIDAAATKPFGFMPFRPGPGVGGHCLPIDPSYLSWQVRRSLNQNFRFIETANDINDHMPDYVVARAGEHLNLRARSVKDSSVLLVGLAYKRNSGDARQSPALEVARRLLGLGARVRGVDPLVDRAHLPAGLELVACTPEEVAAADLVIVLTDHDDLPWELLERHADHVLDTRNRVRSEAVDRL